MGQPIERALLSARKHASRGEVAAAEALLGEVLTRFPGNRRALKALRAIEDAARPITRAEERNLRGLLETGGAAEVVARLQAPLSQAPEDVRLIRLYAAALLGLGRAGDACDCLEAARSHAPDDPELLRQLGQSRLAAGEPEAAAAVFWQAAEAMPGAPEPLIDTARALARAQKGDAAEACLNRAAALSQAPEILGAIADVLEQLGRWEPALRLRAHVASRAGKDAGPWIRLGLAARSAGMTPLSAEAFGTAAQLDPGGPGQSLLGDALRDARDLAGSAAAFESLLARNPRDPVGWVGLGRVDYMRHDPATAIARYRRALEIRPHFVPALAHLGQALVAEGDLAGAAEAYRAVLRQEPGDLAVAQDLLAVAEERDLPTLEAAFERTLRRPDAAPGAQAQARHGLASLAIRKGDPEAAVRELDAAGVLRRRASALDPARHAAELRRIECTVTAPLPEVAGDAPFVPVFVVGMPRSGTTLMEQILARHPRVASVGESHALSRAIRAHGRPDAPPTLGDLAAIRQEYFAAVAKGIEGSPAMVVDKMPMNFRFVAMIAAAFPEARILHMTRTPEAVCWSCYRTGFSDPALDYTFDQTLLGSYFAGYRRLMAHWERLLPGRMFAQGYEALTEAPEREVRRVLGHLGLDWDPAVLAVDASSAPVRTASAVQVRRPIYRGSSDAWRPHAPWLGPMLSALAAET